MPFGSADIEIESDPTEDNRLCQRRGWVAGMFDTAEQAKEEATEPELCESDIVIPNDLAQLQREDPTLVA